MLVTFLVIVTKYLTTASKKGGFVALLRLRVKSGMVAGSEASGHVTSAVRKQSKLSADTQSTSSSLQPRT